MGLSGQPPPLDKDNHLTDDSGATEADEQELFLQSIKRLKQLTSYNILSLLPHQLTSLSDVLYKLEIWGVDIDAEDGALPASESDYKEESQALRYLLDMREAADSITKNLQTASESRAESVPPTPFVSLNKLEDTVERMMARAKPIIMVGLAKIPVPSAA